MNRLYLLALVSYFVLLSGAQAQLRSSEVDTGVITAVADSGNYNTYNQGAQGGWVPPNSAYPYAPPTYTNMNGINNPGSPAAMVNPSSSYHVPRGKSSASRTSSHWVTLGISIVSAGLYFML
uniref:AlNc14C9G1191 protein n=1 Tax=Albugo laibachii Nc14 TaxID=890382 RepID=F0W2E1_9STRA|nr:AlNc14C9G1191 [Albugo laibachii Nc14]|eukprot:CCA15226.1 AlNc14C9G1191 [Albugo laibachii Nc14]